MSHGPANAAGGSRSAVPTAHYPPIARADVHEADPVARTTAATTTNNNNSIRSALSSSPHFRTMASTPRTIAKTTTTTTSTMSDALHPQSRNHPKHFKQAALQFAPSAPARVLACPSHPDVYACINCTFHDDISSDGVLLHSTTDSAGADTNTARTSKRVGPLLLELRRLYLNNDEEEEEHQDGNTNDEPHRQQQVHSRRGGLFSSLPLATSQGNPNLGTSVVSTCMAYPCSEIHRSYQYTSCATGLSTGALAIHSFSSNISNNDTADYTIQGQTITSNVTMFRTGTRHQRQASAVAWRPNHNNNSQVAIGLLSSSSSALSSLSSASASAAGTATGATGGAAAALIKNSSSTSLGSGGHSHHRHHQQQRGMGGSARASPASSGSSAADREFCCLLWDVTKGTTTAPIAKLSHNIGVESLAWMSEGKTLCVGSQMRNFHLYDLRISGTAGSPTSIWAHTEAVSGIELAAAAADGQDGLDYSIFATFGSTVGEPVKLWDTRRMDTSVGEIKVPSGAMVSAIQWSRSHPGTLSVAVGDTLQHYDTTTSLSRPVLTRQSHAESSILDLALFPPLHNEQAKVTSTVTAATIHVESSDSTARKNQGIVSELCPSRVLAVLADRSVHDIPNDSTAPLAISRRDGRVAHAFGSSLWIESSAAGPSAMENPTRQRDEDISARMMRWAKCTRRARYSMDAASNVQMLSEEDANESQQQQDEFQCTLPSTRMLLRLWNWIYLIEHFCMKRELHAFDKWPARGLAGSGVWRLLGMNVSPTSADTVEKDTVTVDATLAITAFDSPTRRVAMSACGWAGTESLAEIQAECESLGEFERSAALAVWHGDIGAAVEALHRGAEVIQSLQATKEAPDIPNFSPDFAETLQLVAMCIAGYRGADPTSSWSPVWRKACSNLLKRNDLNRHGGKSNVHVAYLRSICTFLVNIGMGDELKSVLDDEELSVGDRVAFACRFLDEGELETYLDGCVASCQESGNLEGLVVTGVEKDGLKIVQAYVDKYADVQTAALVCSRVTFAGERERATCSQWLDAYRALLNTWQMWQSRAMFDVDAADYLNKLKTRQDEELLGSRIMNFQSRRVVHPSIPAQLDARCNKCSKSLTGLRGRQEGAAPQRLAKANPKTVLSCCPHCLNALPRCSICLLSLGCLNPYMEAKKERANLPIAEWFTWCMRCKHGGHAHHLVGWFAQHEVCPVSGCDCRCQFDAMQKLPRAVSGVNLHDTEIEADEEKG